MKKAFKKSDLNKVEKSVLLELAEGLGWSLKTKGDIVNALAALQYDETKKFEQILNHTAFETINHFSLVKLDAFGLRIERNIFTTPIIQAFYEAKLLYGYYDERKNIIRF